MQKLDLLIISGGSRGIGRQVAINLSAIAKTVLVIGSSEVVNDIELPGNVIKMRFNLENFEGLKAAVGSALDFSSAIKIGVVLCASQIGAFGGVFDANLDDWGRLFKINVLGNLALVRAVQNLMPSDALLRVAFFAGGGAAYGYPEFSGYALSKVATVRAVENLGMEFEQRGMSASIIAIAPGAVDTEMLAVVLAHGGVVKTRTHIDEPVLFVKRFLLDEIPSMQLNGRFVHVRDDVAKILDVENQKLDLFRLRRIQ